LNKIIKTMKKGFTILEVIVAIFVIITGIVGVMALVTQTIGSVSVSSQKLTAAYLVQEGVEIVRNIRDTNWLEGMNWDDGLGVGDWEGDYSDDDLTLCSSTPFDCPSLGLPLRPLRIDGNFYNYTSGTTTPFFRRITIFDNVANQEFKVNVSVSWQERGKPYEVEAQETLYNWR